MLTKESRNEAIKENGPMPKASEVAFELRRIANALAKHPDSEIYKPWLSFYCDTKDEFLATARVLPRPIQKRVNKITDSYSKFEVFHRSAALDFYCNIPQTDMCVLVEPAKPARYECPSILSAEEEAALGTF